MGILDEIRAEIGGVFEDTALFFSDATLTRTSGGGGWTDTGTTATEYTCKAMIDTYSDHLRAVADIPDTAVKILIVGTSIGVDPQKGDTITVGGRSWGVSRVDVDPARAMWTLQAMPVS